MTDQWEGPTHHLRRPDAVWHRGRAYVPTVYGEKTGNTKWVGSWDEFRAAGGVAHFNEDQTEIVLTLPAGFKFGCNFQQDRT